MSSQQQIKANPQTAPKHGLSSNLVALSAEEKPDFDLLQDDLRNQIKPSGALEELQFRELLIASWRIETINRMQSKNESSEETLSKENEDEFRRLERYRGASERTIHRSMKALTQLQTNRQLHAINQRNLQSAFPGAPVQATHMPAFTDLGKVARDARKLPCKTKPMPSAPDPSEAAKNMQFANMVDHILRSTGSPLQSILTPR